MSAPTDREAVRNFVYFLHDANGDVVYIGRSVDVKARIKRHAANQGHPDRAVDTSRWLPAVRSVSMVGPFNFRDVVARERAEIERHQPAGNVALTGRDHRPFVAYQSARQSA